MWWTLKLTIDCNCTLLMSFIYTDMRAMKININEHSIYEDVKQVTKRRNGPNWAIFYCFFKLHTCMFAWVLYVFWWVPNGRKEWKLCFCGCDLSDRFTCFFLTSMLLFWRVSSLHLMLYNRDCQVVRKLRAEGGRLEEKVSGPTWKEVFGNICRVYLYFSSFFL